MDEHYEQTEKVRDWADKKFDATRKELSELQRDVWDKYHNHTRGIGHLEGWKQGVDERIHRLEKKLDDLLFLLIERQRRPEREGPTTDHPKGPGEKQE
jgi:hypothetical protein